MATKTERPVSPRRWITITEAAAHLGVNAKTIRRRISTGEITAYRAGTRLIRVDLNELDDMLRPIPSARMTGNV